MYSFISFSVVEKHEGGKQPKLINAGEKFGVGSPLVFIATGAWVAQLVSAFD
jgi:hypothetical protein